MQNGETQQQQQVQEEGSSRLLLFSLFSVVVAFGIYWYLNKNTNMPGPTVSILCFR